MNINRITLREMTNSIEQLREKERFTYLFEFGRKKYLKKLNDVEYKLHLCEWMQFNYREIKDGKFLTFNGQWQ